MVETTLHERLSKPSRNVTANSYHESNRHHASNLLKAIVKFASLLSVSLFAGALFGTSCSFNENAVGVTDAYSIEELKYIVHGFNRMMPLLGAICIAATIGSALVAGARRSLLLQIGAILCLVAAGIISSFFCSPIDNQIMTWSTQAPPADWTEFRNEWWQWHFVRMILAIGALSLLIMTMLSRRGATRSATLSLF